jgi:transposase
MGGDDHRCEWRERAEGLQCQLDQANATIAKLTEKLTAIESTVEKLQRHAFGQRSEKMPPVAQAIRDPAKAEAARVAALRTRRENIEKRRQLSTRKIEHKVREDQKTCPKCGGHDFSRLGGGDVTELYDLVPAKVERQLHVQEKLRCRCGETINHGRPAGQGLRQGALRPELHRPGRRLEVCRLAPPLPPGQGIPPYRR